MTTTVTICSDPLALSPESTRDDLLAYAGRLASLLSGEFDADVEVELGGALRVACPHSDSLGDAIHERVADIQAGDEWLELAFGGAE